jgi:prolyl 4-hydroxylase
MSHIRLFTVRTIERHDWVFPLAQPSHSPCTHKNETYIGRPFPMRGKYYANIFVHFEPIGALPFALDADLADIIMDEESKDTMALGLPPYIIPGSEWEKVWREENPRGWQLLHSDVHTAAQDGDWKILHDVAIQNPAALHEPDENGWHPLHEAVRAGDLDVVKFLLDAGSDVNQLTANRDKDGATPLSLAKEEYDAGHPMLELLESYGAVELEPEL